MVIIKLMDEHYTNTMSPGTIFSQNDKALELVDLLVDLDNNISSTENDVSVRIDKACSAIGRLLTIWKFDLSDKIKREFFQSVAVLLLLQGSTIWTLTKRSEKKLDGSYTRKLCILSKSWKQYSTKQQLYLSHFTNH